MSVVQEVASKECRGWSQSFGPPPVGMVPSIVEPRRRSNDFPSGLAALPTLQHMRDVHPFWESRLFAACANGSLGLEDFKFIFGQYYFYSRNFTRYISAAMANCDDDYYRSRLTENLYEEGGEKEFERRHAEIFRCFLRNGLGLELEKIESLDCTKNFVREFLGFCLNSHPMASSAFLSLGTEGIVNRMYRIFVHGLINAGVDEEHLEFFRIHIQCDDEHAETLEHMMCSYFHEPDWFNTCQRAMEYGLILRQRFFENLIDALPHERVKRLIGSVQDEQPRLVAEPTGYFHRAGDSGAPLYSNKDDKQDLEFSVERLPFAAEVLDPRVVQIPVGKCNELHRHGHETVIHIMKGQARVQVGERTLHANAGDTVYVPRWTLHRATNVGSEELRYFAVTDFGFASKVHQGDYLKGHRQKVENDHSFG